MFKKFFLWPIITIVVTFIFWVLYKSDAPVFKCYSSFIEKKELIEILVTVILPTLVVVLTELIIYISKLRLVKIGEKIETIQSPKVKGIAFKNINQSISIISNKLSTMLSGTRTQNVLWELEQLELAEIEIQGINIKNIPKIQKTIRKFRRNRITSIANSLIHKKDFINSNVEYFTTEIRRPSEINDVDKDFRINQLEFLKRYKPKKSYRILILSKKDFLNEYEKNKNELINFINWNNTPYYKKQHTILSIIVYEDNLNDVFQNCAIKNFYDFAISKKGNKKIVFAQKKDMTTLFDSERATNKEDTKNFYECYSSLLKSFNQDNTKIGNIYYSVNDVNIDKLKNFYNFIKNKI